MLILFHVLYYYVYSILFYLFYVNMLILFHVPYYYVYSILSILYCLSLIMLIVSLPSLLSLSLMLFIVNG